MHSAWIYLAYLFIYLLTYYKPEIRENIARKLLCAGFAMRLFESFAETDVIMAFYGWEDMALSLSPDYSNLCPFRVASKFHFNDQKWLAKICRHDRPWIDNVAQMRKRIHILNLIATNRNYTFEHQRIDWLQLKMQKQVKILTSVHWRRCHIVMRRYRRPTASCACIEDGNGRCTVR